MGQTDRSDQNVSTHRTSSDQKSGGGFCSVWALMCQYKMHSFCTEDM